MFSLKQVLLQMTAVSCRLIYQPRWLGIKGG